MNDSAPQVFFGTLFSPLRWIGKEAKPARESLRIRDPKPAERLRP
jgi:hypothetical protein